MPKQFLVLKFTVAVVFAIVAIIGNIILSHPPLEPKAGVPITKQKHYGVDFGTLPLTTTLTTISNTFVQSSPDTALSQFLETSLAVTSTPYGLYSTYVTEKICWCLIYFGWTKSAVSRFLYNKALLYVASEQQLGRLLTATPTTAATLLPPPPSSSPPPTTTLLDVGSGIGTETAKLHNVLDMNSADVLCVENAKSLHVKLNSYGFQAAISLKGIADTTRFTHASLLNVLDRCDAPHRLLTATIHHLQTNGTLVIATVLPFKGKVYMGKRGMPWRTVASRPPAEPFGVPSLPPNASFEQRLVNFVDTLKRHHPRLHLRAWTKLPYVSSGDMQYTHYTIDMSLMVFRVSEAPTKDSTTTNIGRPATVQAVPPMLPSACTRSGDRIYNWLADTVATRHGNSKSWGHVLDAGAGFSSMCWLMEQQYTSLTEITATNKGRYGALDLRKAVHNFERVKIVLGNWKQPDFIDTMLNTKLYDVVVADYLLGAIERHWPYGADTMMDRLLRVVKPGGYLLVVGLEPYELILDRNDKQDRLVLDIESIGDVAARLTGVATYRELPEEWIRHQVERKNMDYAVVATKQFEMALTKTSLGNQLDYAKTLIKTLKGTSMRQSFSQRVKELERALEGFTIHRRARNYALVIQRNAV